MIKTGNMTTQKYEYKWRIAPGQFVLEGVDHFPNFFLIDILEYVTRLTNLHSTYGISFDIDNEYELRTDAMIYLLNESYRNNP